MLSGAKGRKGPALLRFAGGADVDALQSAGAVGFIAKPYELNELSKAVASAIAGDATGA